MPKICHVRYFHECLLVYETVKIPECCVASVVCAVKEIEKSKLFEGEGGKCVQDI